MNSANQNERGVALMIVLFALLLLSVVGLGMMYSTNLETAINGNYRDKQDAFYAALAGLQEGRERIHASSCGTTGTCTYSIAPPLVLPTSSGQNIVYIVPDASTIKPWLAGNTYFDTELCQENVSAVTITAGTAGVPCSAAYASTTWYQSYDDSLTSAAPWNIMNPLDWKWTRIQLKSNNNTPYPVNGNSSNTDQTCWNGTSQMSTPYGASTGCRPRGGVTAIFVSNSGTGYTTAPTVTIGGDGTGATVGTLDMQPEMTGYVSSLTLTTGGSGYTTAPTVTITGDGTGATATATLSTTGTTTTTAGAVATITLTTGGSGYTAAPTVNFTGGGGSGATATAVLSTTGTIVTSGYVTSVTLTTGGASYTSAPAVNFSGGGGGTGAMATATLGTSGKVTSIAMTSVGTQCFSTASSVVVTVSAPSSGTTATANGVLETSKSCIYSINVPSTQCHNQLNSTTYYTHDTTNAVWVKSGVTLASQGNDSFSGTLWVRDSDTKTPQSMSVQNPGYDATNYAANFSSILELYNGGSGTSPWPKTGTGINATFEDCNNITVTATTGYRLASITVTNPGSGYSSTPAVTITGGIGSVSEPTATATVGYPVASVTLTNGGDHYTSAPTVSFSGGGGTGAAATAAVVTTSTTTYPVVSVTLTNGGAGYTSVPTVSFSGSPGSGADATATVAASTITTYPVDSLTLTCSSTSTTSCIGYTTATVTISGGGGSGATATAAISQKSRGTYYLNSIPVTAAGSGYTYDPPITISGGGGSGATATSQISGGIKYGNVWLLTSLAQTRTGARSMLQMEVASPVLGYAPGGALTLDGPCNGCYSAPSSINFTVSGADANSCTETPDSAHPAIDGYDDPNNPTNPSSVSSIDSSIAAVGRQANYTGAGGSPSVENGYASLGPTMTTPTGLNELISNITTTAQTLGPAGGGHVYTGTPANVTESMIALGSCPTGKVTDASCHTVIDVVQGNATINGTGTGYGILVVEGTLSYSGTFTWYGPIFVVGDGIFHYNGGGTGIIQGSLLVAKIWNGNGTTYPYTPLLASNGPPSSTWTGGGTNGINFDHCWSADLMAAINGTYTSTTTLKVLSLRALPY